MQQRSAATARAGPRWIHLSLACLATFALTRLLDRFGAAPPRASSAGLEPAATAAPHASAFAAARRLRRDEALAPRADPPPLTAAAATPTAAPLAVPSRDGRRAGAGKFAPSATPAGGYFIVIGFPIGIDERNRDRRALLRELWYPEYDNIGKTVRVEFVIGLLTYQGDGHEDRIVNELYSEHVTHGDLALVNAREATRDPYRGDPKCTGEKIVAWFQQVVVTHRKTRFFIKADWDTWIHTTRLEVNLRMLSNRSEPLYFGNTLWCSYAPADYQPCGYGFGPLQAAGARTTECPALPRGVSGRGPGSGAVGPFPYTAGLFWGVSYELVRWMAGSRLVYDFTHNASARFRPPYWVKGEDSSFGFFIHISPFQTVTPIHWGWEVVHDGWEFRSQAERGLCTQHISKKSLVVHSMHTRADWELVRKEMRELADPHVNERLPFDVDGLKDLCARNPNIPKVYSKCKHAGFPAADPAKIGTLDGLGISARPRPKCRSEGTNVPFIADKSEGGTIVCDDRKYA